MRFIRRYPLLRAHAPIWPQLSEQSKLTPFFGIKKIKVEFLALTSVYRGMNVKTILMSSIALLILPSCVDPGYYAGSSYRSGSSSYSSLPYGYRTVNVGSNPYYYSGNSWYTRNNGRYTSCARPHGYNGSIGRHSSYSSNRYNTSSSHRYPSNYGSHSSHYRPTSTYNSSHNRHSGHNHSNRTNQRYTKHKSSSSSHSKPRLHPLKNHPINKILPF